MNGKKEYYIVINGVQQSVDAVESLNKQLDALEKRIDALAKKNVNVSASGGGSNKSALDEEAKILQKIDELHQKVAASEKQEYQELLHAKEELKEYQTIAKSIAAQSNLDQGINNTNTMAGMKAQLHDIKAAMQTLDVESDKFKQLQQEANELNNKLKEIEQGYGVFGRNVGNYANGVAQGMQKIVIKVGETERTFESAKEASRTLNNELKSMALNGEQGTKAYKDLDKAVKQMNSTLKDVETSSTFMDNLLDTTQSLVAIASVGKGISALFGIDNEAIDKSIQKLLALQNIMQGIETINKQFTTNEGIGMWLSMGNDKIDKFVDSLFKLDKAAKTTETSVKGVGKAVNTVGVASAASATKITKGAAAIRLLGNAVKFALKAVKIYLIIEAVERVLKFLGILGNEVENTEEKISKLAKVTAEAEKSTAAQATELQGYIKLTQTFNGTQKEEARLVQILNDKYGSTLGQYKTLAEWKDVLIKQGPKYIELLKKQALLQALINDMAEEEYDMKKNPSQYKAKGSKKPGDNMTWIEGLGVRWNQIIDEGKNFLSQFEFFRKQFYKGDGNVDDFLWYNVKRKNLITKTMEEIVKLETEVYGNAEKTTKSLNKSSNAIKANVDIEKLLWDARMALMKDGLAKRVLELRRSRELEIQEARKTGVMVGEQERAISAKYNALIAKEKEKAYAEMMESITQFQFDLNKDQFEQQIRELEQNIDAIVDSVARNNELYSSVDYKAIFGESEKELSDSINKRIEIQKEYNRKNIDLVNKNLKEENEIRLQAIKDNEKEELLAEQKRYEELRDEALQRQYVLETENEKDEEAIKENNKRIEEIERQHKAKVSQIETKSYQESLDIQTEYRTKVAENNQRGYDLAIKNAEEFKNRIDDLLSKQPVVTKAGFINLKATKKQYSEAKDAAKTAIEGIDAEIEILEGELGKADTKQKAVINDSIEGLKRIKAEIKDLFKNDRGKPDFGELWGRIDYYIQAVGQAATQIIQSISEMNDAAFEKEMEAIQERTELLDDELDKQKELTQQYADDVEGIEDELATSRGDRRQHLIDQLNAQMAAQRESLAQEKRIEKEQEKLDAKKKKLEEDNNKRKKSQAITTAVINAALAISNAAVNNWPIPAVPMMALAAAVGAAQVAAVKAAKYADGGVLQGKSHRQGGIKVLGGSAEVEGGEYITNKRTTAKNVDLLDYINSKKRRVDLSDLIEFYADKPKSIRNMSKKYFADGGQLPSLRNDININDRILTAMEQYNERPIYVEVTEIMNKADDVRRVQTLAGL